MAKKQQPKTPVSKKPATSTEKTTAAAPRGNNAWLQIAIALFVTAMCYLPSLKNELVNWDDDPNITENANLQRVGHGQSLGETFNLVFDIETGNVIGNYNPLTIYTFALEKSWTGGEFNDKFIRQIHVDNLLLHLLVVLFSMRVLLLLGAGRWGALVGGLLMGIHPMRVESVAWATERKDVLFAMFFFAALECYIRYVKSGKDGRKWLFFAVSMVLAVLSLYSKVQAVTLVVSMLLVDYLLKRDFSAKVFLEKIPLFAASVAMGLANIHTLAVQGSTDDDVTGFNLIDRACIATWSFSVYLFKLFIPTPLSPLYPYPKPIPWYIYASPLVFLSALGAFYWMWKNNKREWVFGSLFFFLNVAPLLQFFGAGQGYLADRFTYVPYFGFFFIAAWLYTRYADNAKVATAMKAGFGLAFAVFAYMTVQQVGIWKNGETLWSHVMKYEKDPKTGKPNNSLPYWNRGQYLRKQGEMKRALEDYSVAVTVNPTNPELYNSRGKTYFDMATGGKVSENEMADLLAKALKDYTKAIELAANKPKTLAEAYDNRGAAYGAANMFDKSLDDLNKGVAADPTNKNGYFNRSIVYFNLRQYDKAMEDYTNYINIDPYNPNMLYERGMLRRTMKQFPEAIADLTRVIQLKPDFGLAYLERARAYGLSGNKAAATADYQMAKRYGLQMEQLDQQIMAQ